MLMLRRQLRYAIAAADMQMSAMFARCQRARLCRVMSWQ